MFFSSQCKLHSPSTDNHPVQSPLALLWVMLSQWVFAYYELMRNSCPLSTISPFRLYVECLLCGTVWAGNKRLPNLICLSIFACSLPYPDGLSGSRLFNLCSHWSSPTSERLDIHDTPYTSVLIRSLIAGLQSSLYVTACKVARPTPTRAFTLQLSPPKSPFGGVEYDYTGKQSIPATGLSPAR